MPTRRPDRHEPPDTGELSADTAELDVVQQGKSPSRKPGQAALAPPQVRLGPLMDRGLAPAIMAIVERGVRRRPALANALRAEIELDLGDEHPPVRIVFGEHVVLVHDGPGEAPDLRVQGKLADLISLMVAPLLGGLPSPINARGRAALGMVAVGRVRVQGKLALLRRLLAIIRI